MRARAHVFLFGVVQGVFFRSSLRRLALKLGVGGFARNLPDGRVEAVFEGEKENIGKMLEFCRKGTAGAVVDKVEIVWEKYKGEFDSFEILY